MHYYSDIFEQLIKLLGKNVKKYEVYAHLIAVSPDNYSKNRKYLHIFFLFPRR